MKSSGPRTEFLRGLPTFPTPVICDPLEENTDTQLTWKSPSKGIFETKRDQVISPETGPEFGVKFSP